MDVLQSDTRRGFTLIELLVVIAIIGILASVVLSSLGSAREKSRDGAALMALSHARSGAEIVFSSNNSSFNNLCPSDVSVPVVGGATNGDIILSALEGGSKAFDLKLTGGGGADDNYDTGGGTPDVRGDIGCQSDANEYMIQMYLSPTKTACFDGYGFSGGITSAKATNLANGAIRCN